MRTWSLILLIVVYFFASTNDGVKVICKENFSGAYTCRSDELIQIRGLDVPPSAVRLDLSYNKLSLKDGLFSKFINLTALNLSHSRLSNLTTDVFQGLDSVTKIDLSNNNLVNLPFGIFKNLNNLAEVNLQNNKWNCNCERGLLTLLKTTNVSLGLDPALCHTPASFNETRIDESCDKNECLEENDCDDMAVCRDTRTSYTCECQTRGFEGTGTECTDIDECAGANGCSKNGGQCVNTHGSYTCSCEKGYQGDGYTCQDVDECELHQCGSGECKNTEGSFTCLCYDGYMESRHHLCVDIDECKTTNHTCHTIEHSYCHNLEKLSVVHDGYECLCETGFRKVGKSCVLEGNMTELINILGLIIGIFFGVLVIIMTCALTYRKCKMRKPKADPVETNIVMAPMVGLGPPVDFAFLGMPQEMPQEDNLEWMDEDEDEDDTWLE